MGHRRGLARPAGRDCNEQRVVTLGYIGLRIKPLVRRSRLLDSGTKT